MTRAKRPPAGPLRVKGDGAFSMNVFDEKVLDATGNELHSMGIETIQVNVGLKCNQACKHCHVGASPKRTESMDWATMEKIVSIARKIACRQVDITGGAPELNPHLQRLITDLRQSGIGVQVRTNFTVLLEPGYEDYPKFFRDNEVQIVGSLPCYLEQNVDAQRGVGAYQKSIEAIKRLNALGYGLEDHLPLNLVYNPLGPQLPPEQESLEADYRRELRERFGIEFTHLLTLTNLPIGRFIRRLEKINQAEQYRDLLESNFNPATLAGLMCRRQISIRWDGTLYDCDFNLALNLPVNHGVSSNLEDFDLDALTERRIVTQRHCFGCTAGCGSSCGGALVQ
jgi:radical SAM/Cys-rich protein